MAKIYSTLRVARGARLRYWNDLHSSLLAPLEIKPRDRGEFDASSSVDQLGQLRVVKTESAPASIEHEAQHVARTKERRFRVLLAARGRLAVRHAGREALLSDGDYAMLDDSVPYRIEFDEPSEAICVAIAPKTMKTYLPAPAGLCGLAMSTDRALNKVVSSMLVGLWAELENDLASEQRPALARSFLQVVAASYAVEHTSPIERSVMAAARRSEIKQFIEAHLRSPELSPTMIAGALSLSRRYLRLLFAVENESLTGYIRRRRLEECACELAQPLWQGRSITATASDWGFRNVTHFARAFKKLYGTTPSAFKQQRFEAAAH